MMKFVFIVMYMMSYGIESSDISRIAQINDVKVEFSEKAIGIESGQPIFSKNIKIWVSNPTDENYQIFVNEEEKVMKNKKIEISGLESGTYTLMILPKPDSSEEKRTVGFTIQ